MQHPKWSQESMTFPFTGGFSNPLNRAYCGSEVDIWSLGVILYALLTGTLPFDDNNLPNLFQKIREAKVNPPLYLSAWAKDLIIKMMQANPLNRITIPEIKNHPWYTFNLPFYLQIMDNTQSEIENDVDPAIFRAICEVSTLFLLSLLNRRHERETHSQKKEYGITLSNVEDVKRKILERKIYPYCIAYELMKAQAEKFHRGELLTRTFYF